MTQLTFNLELNNGRHCEVTIRPRTPEDKSAVTRLYQEIPEEDLDFFISDVTDPAVIDAGFSHNALIETSALIAETSDAIIGEAVLIRQKSPRLSHVGNIRFYIDTRWRHAGLGATLVSTLFTTAMNMGIEKVSLYLPQAAADKYDYMLLRNGFSREATLKHHFRSRTGLKSDIVIYGRDLEELWHQISDWVSNYGRAMEY